MLDMRYNVGGTTHGSTSRERDDSLPCPSFEFQFPIPKSKTLSLSLISDIHLGAPDVDLSLLHHDLASADRILLGGDLLDLILPSDSKRYAPSCLHPRLAGSADPVGEALSWLHDLLAPHASKIDFLGSGNHEASFVKHHSFDPLTLLAKSLSLPYGGLSSWLTYSFSSLPPFRLFYHHGWGKSSNALNQFQALLSRVENADAFWLGHYHTQLCTKLRRLTPSGPRTIYFLRSGSYRLSPLSGTLPSYSTLSFLQPQSLGCAKLSFSFTSSSYTVSASI